MRVVGNHTEVLDRRPGALADAQRPSHRDAHRHVARQRDVHRIITREDEFSQVLVRPHVRAASASGGVSSDDGSDLVILEARKLEP